MAHKNTCVVYTCITNGYDNLIRHKFSAPDWDYVCFTDNAKLLKRGRVGRWQIRPLAYDKSERPLAQDTPAHPVSKLPGQFVD